MKIAYITLGCKLNYAETSTYERLLVKEGKTTVPWTDPSADVFLVNTCSVTEHSDKKGRNIIRKLHRQSPDAAIVVTGCYAQLKHDEIMSLEGVSHVFGAKEKSSVVPYILSLPSGNPPASCSESFFPAFSSGERTRSFLKVQDGCDFKCNYCTVPYARGESRSITVEQAVCQAREIAAEGIKEIVLTGVNTGDFGKGNGETFFDLIKELDKVEGIERYRISSIEPNLITDEAIDWISSGKKFLPHFHIPLQSGCDEVLLEMGRHYDTSFFARKIKYIRERMEKPGKLKVFFGIDVIVGFPGETDERFEKTYHFLENEVKPSFIHIFPYSKRPGTPAASRKDQVQDIIKTRRVERLEELSARLNREFMEASRGMKANVLFESSDKSGQMLGYTENYIQISRPYDRNVVGKIAEVII